MSVLIIGISIVVFFLSKLNFLKNINFENSTNNTEIVFQTNEKFNLEKLDSYKNKLVSSQYNFKDENKKTFVYKFDKTDEAQEFHKIISNEEHVQSINLQNYLN